MQAIRFFETLPDYTALHPKKMKILIDEGSTDFLQKCRSLLNFIDARKAA